jgi:membrane associated rhomboid family serine protease
MYRGRTLTFSLPPFTYWVKRLMIACAGIFFLEVALKAMAPNLYGGLLVLGGLIAAAVVEHGWIWQVVTYSFLHGGLGHLLMNMLTLWFIGATLERDWGPRKFLECYLFCVVGAALVTLLVAYLGLPGLTPETNTIGASGGIFGLLMAFGILYGDQEMFMFPLPFMIKARYVVGIWIFIVIIATFQPSQGGVANFAHLGGLFFGFVFVKLLPRRGLTYGLSEQYFALRNWYYRWKRRRAAKKFEVYMRQHDRNVTFDEHGNYIPPGEDKPGKKNGGGPSGWVN